MIEFMNLEMSGTILALFGAAVANLANVGSAIGTGIIGVTGAGVLSEDPKKFGPVLLLEAIPSTQSIYGLLITLMIMMQVGLFEAELTALTFSKGLMILIGAIPVGVVGILSAIAQAKVAASGVLLIAKRPEELAKSLILAAMVETYMVLSLLVSFLIVSLV